MPTRIKRLFERNAFLRNVGILAGGTAFSQLLIALSLPILTRLYTAEDFSHLAVYMALMGVFTVVACLRFNLAIPLPDDDRDGLSLTVIALISGLIFSAILAIPIALFPAEIASLVGKPSFLPYLWMLPFGVFLASGYAALQYWSSRKKRFPLIAKTQLTQAIGGSGAQLALGVGSPSPFGLIFGHMLFGGLGIFGLLRAGLKLEKELLKSVTFSRVVENVKKYRRFPVYSVPEAFFNTAGVQVPVLIVAAYAIGPEAGYLMLAMRVLGLPMTLIGRSVSQVYLAEAPQKMREGQLLAFTRATVISLAKVGVVPLLVAGIASPYLFPILFGPEWERAGYIVSWMVPWFIIQFVTTPVSVVLHVTGHLGTAMLLQLSGTLLRIGSVTLVALFEPYLLVEVYSISGFLFYLIYFYVILVVVRRNTKSGVSRGVA